MADDRHKGEGGQRRFAEVFSDLPVTGSEGLAFGFQGLARTLAELAQNPRNRTPFTVVVRGDWGRGKTTLMRQVERLLAEATAEPGVRRVHTLWFNAWKYPNEETVLAGLLGALLDELRRGDLVDQLKLAIDERKDRLAKRVLKIAAPWLDDLGEDGSRYSEAEDRRAFYDAFRRLFAEAWYLWQHGAAAMQDTGHRRVEEELREREGERTLAVFLDDLDRCRESRVLEVLEAINALPGPARRLFLPGAGLETSNGAVRRVYAGP